MKTKTKHQDFLNSEKFSKGTAELASTLINTLKGLPFLGGLIDDLDRKIPEWVTGISDVDRVTNLLQEIQSLSAKRNTTIGDINKIIASLENAGFSVSGKVKSAISKAKSELSARANELAKHDLVAQTLADHALNIANRGETYSDKIRGQGIDKKINKIKENIYEIQEKFK